jgi:hypothetical protein
MLKKLWNDEVGALLSAEFVLLATILVLGAIVGLKAVQEAIVTELADVGQAIAEVNQSYTWSSTTGHTAATAGSTWLDSGDFCDGNGTVANARCVVVTNVAINEGDGAGTPAGG